MPALVSYDENDIRRLAPMPVMIEELRQAFAQSPSHIARQHFAAADGEFLMMPAADAQAVGVKLVMIQPRNADRGLPVIQGTYVLFDARLGHPAALLDGAALTLLRTPAASAVATNALARADATTLGLIGSGPQSRGHFEAMLAVRPGIEHVIVASRSRANAQKMATSLTAPGVQVVVGEIEDAALADIVCVSTRATEPLISLAMVRPGTHVNAIGAYRLDMRELAGDLIGSATVTVDDLDAAQAEAGDLAIAVDEGHFRWEQVAGDLSRIAQGACARSNPEEITVFKSVGLAIEDLVVARLVHKQGSIGLVA
jgi:ornithine cyclodeaminase/alanine dehydrogenase-like protein (mu-crystallin family)